MSADVEKTVVRIEPDGAKGREAVFQQDGVGERQQSVAVGRDRCADIIDLGVLSDLPLADRCGCGAEVLYGNVSIDDTSGYCDLRTDTAA